METNKHHIYWERREFEKQQTTKRIRNHRNSIIELPVDIHNDLHAETLRVPAPNLVLARFVLKTINDRVNEYNALETIKSTIDEVYAYDDDESELLATRLDAQVPYLEEGQEAINHRYFVMPYLQTQEEIDLSPHITQDERLF